MMNPQPAIHSRSLANGIVPWRVEENMRNRIETKFQSGKSDPQNFTTTGELTGSKDGGCGSLSRDRLLYLTACLIGYNVEAQVKNGSIYSGIFHATNAENDFGIILKMARLIKDTSLRGGQKYISESSNNVASKVLIIPATELVQVIAKDVSVTMEGFANDLQRENQQEIMIDSFISQNRHVELERELERWVPDEDNSPCPELDNIFDDHWNRNWDQFQTNEALFGVKSTFDEELYTTKLERGPQMKELEREALRIAREIEGEETGNFHLAEERGIQAQDSFDLDEETKYSSVIRGVDDSGYEENEDIYADTHNFDTFGDSISDTTRSLTELKSIKSNVGTQVSSNSSSMDEAHSSQLSTSKNVYHSNSSNHAKELASEPISNSYPALDGESRVQADKSAEQYGINAYTKDAKEKQTSSEKAQMYNLDGKGLFVNNSTHDPASSNFLTVEEKTCSVNEISEEAVIVPIQGVIPLRGSQGLPASLISSTSDRGASAALKGPSLSPSSSMGSLSSEKSALNPHAKEFKFNPNAKSFIPSQTSVRTSPATDGSYYFPANMPPVSHRHGLPLGIGGGPSFPGHQHVATPQMQPPHAYFHPNGPQMIVGHPQVLYMPGYLPEMAYKGRDF